MGEIRIRCFVDFGKNGKQISHLQLPYSSNISADGWIGIPICVIKNGAGPTLYLGAGNHGDEYEGQSVLSHLIRDLDPARISGRLIILPATNVPAACRGHAAHRSTAATSTAAFRAIRTARRRRRSHISSKAC